MADQETIYAKLIKIQHQLKAPKSEHNSFSGFDYRSAEKILEAVKPLCHSNDLALLLSDGTKETGGWHYVVATAILTDGKDSIKVTAEAREQEVKKGMDSSQITGSTSSYARKYALNGLFAIDDTKDADGQDNRAPAVTAKPKVDQTLPTNNQLKELKEVVKNLDLDDQNTPEFFQDAIGKPKPRTKEDFTKSIQFGNTILKDQEDRAKEVSENA